MGHVEAPRATTFAKCRVTMRCAQGWNSDRKTRVWITTGNERVGPMKTQKSYVLLYAERSPRTSREGRTKRIDFPTLRAALDGAQLMTNRGELSPLEIRDQHDTLVTCDAMGWRISALAKAADMAR